MQVSNFSSRNPGNSRRITSGSDNTPKEPSKNNFEDLFQVEEVASFTFKPGEVTLGDLGSMLKKKEGGGFTLSVPSEVIESSTVGGTEPARPEVLAKIDALTGQPVAGIKHTTRSMPRREMHSPSAPKPFAAGRFQVDFGSSNGPKTGLIFQTEAGPGHLASITPGETPIEGGFISFLSNPDDAYSTGVSLNKAEENHLLSNLYDRFSEPMTQKQADQVDNVIGYTFAIHHKEGGEGAQVQSSHQEMAAEVAAKSDDGGSNEMGWNLR